MGSSEWMLHTKLGGSENVVRGHYECVGGSLSVVCNNHFLILLPAKSLRQVLPLELGLASSKN